MRSGRITAVQQDGKNKRRYHVYVDDQFAFSVHEDILVKYRLLKGTELDREAFAEILEEEERNKAYLLALRYVGIRPRTAAQLERYLAEKGHDAETAREIRRRCESQGYIDDEAFARQWVRERMRLKARSLYAVKRELQMKGVAADIIDAALREVSRDDELEAARKLAAKRLRGAGGPIDAAAERKLLMLLARNGFSSSVISQLRSEWRAGGSVDDP
ncbi:RecX family transcriptional regulator [Brevibacillus sp. SYP-B805]|uniref:RecX family transcriptional regulator n=1 Tax=Brevibacillus sp. SYP-B805 TaxID=1578199 RepID=UPI0013EDDBFA|nr:RecX family transcriptional regulator [Brevibacillus sp. SYP-B805]NGQ96392.1 RecX family transcriptional regulator [Brevibacillus sp. SYP-B805]